MPTIAGTLRSTAARVPDREALVFGDTRYSYAELDTHVDKVASVLIEQGVAKGDRVALMSMNSDRFVIAFYAIARVGAVAVPVNPASAAPELDYLIGDSGAKVLIFDPALFSTVHGAVAGGLLDGIRVLSTYPADGFEDLFALAAQQSARPIELDVADFDNAEILYTSGRVHVEDPAVVEPGDRR